MSPCLAPSRECVCATVVLLGRVLSLSLRTGVDNVQRAKVILVGPPTMTIIAAFRAGHARCTRSSRVYAVSPLLRSTVSDGADKKVKETV